jgi:rRNA maturation endonuclease Nob1
MKNIILDTSILLRQPRILGLTIPDTKFLIPIAIVEELIERTRQRGAKFDRRVDLIEKAAKQGTVSILALDESSIKQFRESHNLTKLSKADISIVAIATSLKSKNEDVTIATLDNDIIKFAQDNKIGVLSEVGVSELSSTFTESQTDNNNIQTEIVSYENKERQSFWKGISIGIFATLIAIFAFKNIELVISTINVWGTITIILLAGFGLFIFREKQRLAYGVFEFLVGVVAIISLFAPNDFDFNTITFNLDFNIKLIGGLYIMVRGQDNIVKALKDKKIGLWLKDKYGIG